MPTMKVRTADGAQIPEYATAGSAGMDLRANESLIIPPKAWRIVSTGLFFEIPVGYEVQIRSRSGLASKGITVMNQPGTVDSDYRGEVKVILLNHNTKPWHVAKGDRVAQAVPSRVDRLDIHHVDQLQETARGSGGLGSTGR